jgi:predicted transglutaminase-like protease
VKSLDYGIVSYKFKKDINKDKKLGFFENKRKRLFEKQFLPTFEDINAVEKIGKNLSSYDLIETASNTLEWENRNIHYWYVRSDLNIIRDCGYTCLKIISYFIFVLIIFIFAVSHFTHSQIGFQKLVEIQSQAKSAFSLIFNIIVFLLGWIICTMFYEWFTNKHFLAKNNIKTGSWKELSAIIDSPNMIVKSILKYKIAICGDYAKLSCALLATTQIFDDFLYLIFIPRHGACAIKYNETYYIIDQTLPLKPIDLWLAKNHKKEASLYKLEIDRKNKLVKLNNVERYYLDVNFRIPDRNINTSYIQNKVCKLFNVTSSSPNVKDIIIDMSINDNIYYDNITKTSFVYMIKRGSQIRTLI